MVDKYSFDGHIHVESDEVTPYTALSLIRRKGLKAALVDHVFSDRHRITPENIKNDCREKYSDVAYIHGCEADVYGDGLIALPENMVPAMDFIMVSFTHLGQPGVIQDFHLDNLDKMAKRLLFLFEAAINWPHTDVIGHPFAMPCDPVKANEMVKFVDNGHLDSLLRLAAKRNILIEINARTLRRMAVEPQKFFIERALENGCSFSIGSDAHCLDEIGMTREAWTLIDELHVPYEKITFPYRGWG